LQFAEEEVKSNTYMLQVLMARQLTKKKNDLVEMEKVLSLNNISHIDIDALSCRVSASLRYITSHSACDIGDTSIGPNDCRDSALGQLTYSLAEI